MKLVSLVNRPLGLGNSYSPTRKEWIPAVIGAAAAIGSSLIGASASKSAADRAARKEEEWYNKEYARELRRANESILDKASGQNLMRMAKEHARDQWKKTAGAQAVSGGTASATQMAKDAGNKMVADTAANLAAMDTARQERADDKIAAINAQHAQRQIGLEQQKGNAVAQVAGAASNAIMQGASAFAADTNLSGGSNNGQIKPMSEAKVINQEPKVAPSSDTNISGGVLGKMASETTDANILRAKRLIGGY